RHAFFVVAAGNLVQDLTSRLFAYDAENRQVSFTDALGTVTYGYDGEGRRVEKIQSGEKTVYVYNVLGQLIAEYREQGPQGSGGTFYPTGDHLGSTRVVTDQSRVVKSRHDYLPFGEELTASFGRAGIPGYGNHPLRQKLTAKERDSESNLDYFGARYFSGAQGRFTSPDKPFADQHEYDPESWNLYSYARNNPLRFIDLQGEAVIESRKIQTYKVQGSTASEAFANARKVSGFKSDSAEAMSGLTSARMGIANMRVQDSVQPGNVLVDSFAASELVSADVKLDQTITLPEWSDRAAASPEEQAAWDVGLGGLKEHEEQHATINRQQAEKLDRALPGTRGFGQAPAPVDAQRKARSELSSKVRQKQQRNIEETRKRQRKLDDDTDHGRRQ
ncbi:MAG: DUF922 domain-containing protein, partial [Acidobacteriota bacterium]